MEAECDQQSVYEAECSSISLCPVPLEEGGWQEFNLMFYQIMVNGARHPLLCICQLVRSCLSDSSGFIPAYGINWDGVLVKEVNWSACWKSRMLPLSFLQ